MRDVRHGRVPDLSNMVFDWEFEGDDGGEIEMDADTWRVLLEAECDDLRAEIDTLTSVYATWQAGCGVPRRPPVLLTRAVRARPRERRERRARRCSSSSSDDGSGSTGDGPDSPLGGSLSAARRRAA